MIYRYQQADLTEEVFYQNLYAKPRQLKSNKAGNELRNELAELREMKFTEEEINLIIRNTKEAENFEWELAMETPVPIFVRGYSGFGKTTFIRTRLHKLVVNDSNNVPIIMNLQESRMTVLLFKRTWENTRYRETSFKLISVLLDLIESVMNKKKDLRSLDAESDNDYRARLKRIFIYYDENFQNSPGDYFDAIFNIIKDFIDEKLIYNEKNNTNTFCHEMHEAIIVLISDAFDTEEIYSDRLRNTINRLLRMISLFLHCENPEARYYLLLDNIEYYIRNDRAYDEDIIFIVGIIRLFTRSVGDFLKNNGIVFSRHFKMIIAIRDTTYKLMEHTRQQFTDFPVEYIDVSNFYHISDIIDKKRKFFSKNEIVVKHENVIELVVDILKEAGLKSRLPRMYNNNMRRLVDYMIEIISNNMGRVEKIRSLAKHSTRLYHNGDEVSYNALRHGVRSSIMRLLLDMIHIESRRGSYFERIRSISPNVPGFGFAHRILEYLYNHSDEYNEDGDYIGFYTLMKDVFSIHRYDKLQDNVDEVVAEILQVLDDSEIDTKWCQLALLKFNHSDTDPEALKNEIKRQFKDRRDKTDSYGIKNTSAGRVFVRYISTHFEYYACRFYPQSLSLFEMCEPSMHNDVIDLINGVQQEAFRSCIQLKQCALRVYAY